MKQKRRLSRRVFYALLAVLLWMGFLVDGSHALYTDQVQLTGNSITSGTANLLISNSQNSSSTVYEKSRVGFSANLSPGQQYEKFFFLKNASDEAVDFKLSLSSSIISDEGEGMGNQVKITVIEVDHDGNVGGNQFTTTVGAIRNTMVDSGLVLPSGTTQRYKLVTKLDESFLLQGKTVIYDLLFNGTQVLVN